MCLAVGVASDSDKPFTLVFMIVVNSLLIFTRLPESVMINVDIKFWCRDYSLLTVLPKGTGLAPK